MSVGAVVSVGEVSGSTCKDPCVHEGVSAGCGQLDEGWDSMVCMDIRGLCEVFNLSSVSTFSL